MPWNPAQYLGFAGERLRPALDLLAHITLDAPAHVVDLGCGAGNVTRLLRERWPHAHFTGVDSSAEMLARAALEAPGVDWRQADIATWSPATAPDVIYSNAVLHWLDDHATLLPQLLHELREGGVLAIQVPNNFTAASHQCAFDAASEGPWRDRLAPLLRRQPVHDPASYFEWLAPHACSIDIWQTEYLHVLAGDNPVADWTRGSLLVPLLEVLGDDEGAAFEAEYRRRIRLAYPARYDGRTLFAFRRLFIVAQR